MLLSRKLLNDVNPVFKKLTDSELSKLCNRVGIEVEQIIYHHEMKGLYICYLEEVEKHPNADKLSVAKVRLSKNELVTVVCGAANIRAKKYAIYAPVGTAFLDGRVIEQRDIRGVDSCGMLCGFQELTTVGIENISDEDADGIVMLDKATLGDTNIGKYINNDDVIFDLSIPSNRNDLNALYNLEHELCYGLQTQSFLPNELINEFKKQTFKLNVDKELANDFGLIYIKEWPKYKTPWYQREILMSSGYKVHNNILDLMNTFTLMYGSPIHVYSGTKVDPKSINVKTINKSTNFSALDGKTYEVPAKSIGIWQNNELINVAGIIGAESSKYDHDNSIIIEVANFNSSLIRATAQKMKINTKAQAFFSKPVSGWITQHTFFAICEWLKERNIKFQYGYDFVPVKSKTINYKEKSMLNFIGTEGFKYKPNEVFTKEKFHVHPSRIDIKDEYDVYEEIMKIIDINTLVEKPISFDFKFNQTNQTFRRLNRLKHAFVNYGLIETKTYNLVNETDYNKFNFWKNENKIAIANPISKHHEVMRVSLIDEMLKVIQYNISRKRQLYNIFEVQPIHDKKRPQSNLSMVFCNALIDNKINQSSVGLNVLSLKSMIKNAFSAINIDLTFETRDAHIKELYNNQMTTILWKDQVVGYIGQIKNNILKKYDIQQKDVFAVSIDITDIIEHKNDFKLQAVSNFPTVYRDINVNMDKQYNVNTLIDQIKKIEFVSDCWVKDAFNSDSGVTSYTFALKIGSLTTTLQSSQIDNTMAKVKQVTDKL